MTVLIDTDKNTKKQVEQLLYLLTALGFDYHTVGLLTDAPLKDINSFRKKFINNDMSTCTKKDIDRLRIKFKGKIK